MTEASALQLVIGRRARRELLEHGFRPELFDTVLGASGGPKWLVLSRLDQRLFPLLARQDQGMIRTVGTSIGAWRMSCLAQPDPAAAIRRLEDGYIAQRYDSDPSPREVSRQARAMLDHALAGEGIAHLVGSRQFQTHVVVARGRNLLAANGRLRVSLGSAATGLANTLSRRLLPLCLERICFHSGRADTALRFGRLPVRHESLTRANAADAILASGSIPLVMRGVDSIQAGATYWDGGMIDYHFEPLPESPRLALYPHFYPHLVPGWFDKPLPWRRQDPATWERLLLISPSRQFVAQLPFGKIPDRGDFRRLDNDERQHYWHQVVAAGARLADEFEALLDHERLLLRLQQDTGKAA